MVKPFRIADVEAAARDLEHKLGLAIREEAGDKFDLG
jgi:hypothetical protein